MLMKRTPMRDYMLIALGALLMAIGSKNIYDSNQLVVGGVTGLGIILRSWIGMPLWLSNTLLNIPLFLAAWSLSAGPCMVRRCCPFSSGCCRVSV